MAQVKKEKTKQDLVDICFEIAMTVADRPDVFSSMSRQEIAEWTAKQLKMCGFPTQPCGASWGLLIEEDVKPQTRFRVSDYTFENTVDLFDEKVVMVLRNKDKKHIVSLSKQHRIEMIYLHLNPDDKEHVLVYLEKNKYL
jgi:hypothetical protein